MSSDAEFCSVEVVDLPSSGGGGDLDPGPYVFIRVKIAGRIRRTWIKLEELIKSCDALDKRNDADEDQFDDDPERDERVKAFVRERAEAFLQIIERVGKEDRACDERGGIQLTVADLANLCP